MIGYPQPGEAAPYYFAYIERLANDDAMGTLEAQLAEAAELLPGIGEEKSLYRYAPEKWSIRQVLNHINDTERIFVSRALWFARGFDSELPGFDQHIAAAGARADEAPWAGQVEEFRGIRQATLAFFRHLPRDAWARSGVASGNSFTVRALAFIVAGHYAHHLAIVKERYL